MENLNISLQRFDKIPDVLYSCASTDLESVLGSPSLFFVEGRRTPPLFVTVLQHGNEPTGFDAVQAILNKYRQQMLPRSMWLFIANVSAAKERQRVLDSQTDYNRAWPGTIEPASQEAGLMGEVVKAVTAEPLFASIDLHNNTGTNPHYACLNKLEPRFLNLATLFARTVVFYQQPVGTQSLAMAQHCPAVTLECGKAGEEAALDHAIKYIDACLHMSQLPDQRPAKGDIILLKTRASVKMKPEISFGFENSEDDVRFRGDLDQFNFGCFETGEWLAELKPGVPLPVTAITDGGDDIAAQILDIRQNKLAARSKFIPSMATLDTEIIRQDCLFYIMEEMNIDLYFGDMCADS